MRAAVLTRFGGPDAVELRDVPDPRPGPGQVLVRVAAAATNNTDLWTREGAYGLPGDPDALAGWLGPVDFPRIQGADVCGRVEAVGDGVEDALVGRRVLVDPATFEDAGDRSGREPRLVAVLGSEYDGGFAELVVVDADHVHDMSGSPLSDAELACLPIAYGTAMGMLERGSLGAGETVLVTGASGGVGLAAVQLAAARGCRVVAQTSAGKEQLVRDAGADAVVDRSGERTAPTWSRTAWTRSSTWWRGRRSTRCCPWSGKGDAGWWPVRSPIRWCASTSAGSTWATDDSSARPCTPPPTSRPSPTRRGRGRWHRASPRRTPWSRSTRPTPSWRSRAHVGKIVVLPAT